MDWVAFKTVMEPYLIFLYFREWWKGTEVCVCVYDSPIIPGAVLVSSAHPLQPLCVLPPASCSLNSHRQKRFLLLLVFVILIVQRIVSPHTHFPFLARLVDRCVLTHELLLPGSRLIFHIMGCWRRILRPNLFLLGDSVVVKYAPKASVYICLLYRGWFAHFEKSHPVIGSSTAEEGVISVDSVIVAVEAQRKTNSNSNCLIKFQLTSGGELIGNVLTCSRVSSPIAVQYML